MVGFIAGSIFKRYGIGNAKLQVKHLQWYLHMRQRQGRKSIYLEWLVIQDFCHITKRAHWIKLLDGPWVRPSGERGKRNVGRPSRCRM